VFLRVHQTLSLENLASQVLDLETGFSSYAADFSLTPQRMLSSVVEVSEEERGQRVANNDLSDAETQGVYWPATAIKRVMPLLGKELVSVYGGTFKPAKPGKKEAEWSLSGKVPTRSPAGNIFPDNEAEAVTKEATGRYLAQLQADTDNVAMVLNRLPAIAINTAVRTISPYGGAGAYFDSVDLGMLSANMADEKDAPGTVRMMWPAAQESHVGSIDQALALSQILALVGVDLEHFDIAALGEVFVDLQASGWNSLHPLRSEPADQPSAT
jgi:hypothetical protein